MMQVTSALVVCGLIAAGRAQPMSQRQRDRHGRSGPHPVSSIPAQPGQSYGRPTDDRGAAGDRSERRSRAGGPFDARERHQGRSGPKKYKVTTDSDHTFNIAPNLLDQDFTADGPNQKWAGDISYIWTSEGWLYLAVILDLYSRRVIGWAVSNRMKRDLAIRALDMAVALRQTARRLHSPYGSRVAILFQRVSTTLVKARLQGLDERQGQLLRQFDG